MYYEGSGRISKLTNSFVHESLYLQTAIAHYRVEVRVVNNFQSIYC
jgi:hypothetical protein